MAADRAVSTTVGYAITLIITTLLVTGLLIAGGDFVADQRDGAARNELRVLGQQVAADVAAADRLGRISGPDGDLVLSRSLPDQVTGATYTLNVTRVGSRDTYEIFLESDTVGQSGTVRVYSQSPAFTRGTMTGGDVQVEYNSVTREIAIKRDRPYVFPEDGGRIVIEAESFPADEPGSNNASTHYWIMRDDDPDASGDAYVQPRPDDGVNTFNDAYGPRLDYEVRLSGGSTYFVWVRTKGSDGNSDSVHVGLEGTPATDVSGGLGLGDTNPGDGNWDWSNQITDTTAKTQISVGSDGTYTLNVWMREDGTKLDKIVLTTSDPPAFDTGSDPGDTGPSESDWQ